MPMTVSNYLAFGSAEAEVIREERCVSDIKTWMTFHKLKMNDDKAEMLEIQSKWDTSSRGITHTRIGEESISLSDAATSLGVLLDRHFNLHAYVRRACRSAYLQLKQISDVRSFLSQRIAETLVHAFIMSKLDYCNALLYGLPDRTVALLKRVQNAAARVVTRSWKSDHITPIDYCETFTGSGSGSASPTRSSSRHTVLTAGQVPDTWLS